MAKLRLKMREGDVVWVGLIVVLLGVGIVAAAAVAWDSGKTMFHSTDNVRINIEGTDYSLQEAIDNNLIGGEVVDGSFTLENCVWRSTPHITAFNCPANQVIAGIKSPPPAQGIEKVYCCDLVLE